jgi:excisionase family DNA binding protein
MSNKSTSPHLPPQEAPVHRVESGPPPETALTIPIGTSRQLFTSLQEAADRLGIGRTFLLALIDAGRITSVKIGRRRLIPTASLEAFAAEIAGEK